LVLVTPEAYVAGMYMLQTEYLW